MTGFDAYQKFLSIKQHFTSDSYDYGKYNGKLNLDPSKFQVRKDKFFFEKLAKKKDIEGYVIANILCGNIFWVGDLFSDKAEKNYTDWLKRKESLSYIFKNDIKNLLDDFNQNFIVRDGQHPYLLKTIRQDKISIETFVILSDIVGFIPHWNKNIKENIIWPIFSRKCLKYRPFMSYDRPKFKAILREKYID
jgi:hypothetical protein